MCSLTLEVYPVFEDLVRVAGLKLRELVVEADFVVVELVWVDKVAVLEDLV